VTIVLTVIGILGFGYWGVLALLRPQALYADFRQRLGKSGTLSAIFNWWFSSPLFLAQMRLLGSMSLAAAGLLIWCFLLELRGVTAQP
jgi:hypothetical protein